MPDSLLRFAATAAVLLAVTITAHAQAAAVASRMAPTAPALPAAPAGGYPSPYPADRMSVVDPDKKLSAGDQVTVEIVEDREGGLPRVVTAAGELDVPPLGRVRVSGKTVTDASAVIKQLLEKDYYYTATVRVSIDQVSRVQVQHGSVILSGQVRMQGPQIMIAGEPLTVTSAILKAGGLTEWGNARKVQVTRQTKAGAIEKFEVDFKKITESGDVKADPILQDGDRIFVPKVIVRF